MVDENLIINKPDIVKAYYEIEKRENKKENLINLYCLRYDIKSSEIKQIIVDGGKKMFDALLNKVIKSDEYLDEIIKCSTEIASWTNYLNKEIETMLKNGDDTPVIVFYKEQKDLKKHRCLTFIEIAEKIFSSERTVKRKYYDYKNATK